jgi:hypothetical protein
MRALVLSRGGRAVASSRRPTAGVASRAAVASWPDERIPTGAEQPVARMNVEARAVRVDQGEGGGGGAGGGAAVIVSVTDDAGRPIVDLVPGQLLVRAIGGGGGATVEVAVAEVASRGEGIYVATIAPGAGAGWPSGEHVLAVVVRRAFDRGQSLAVLTIP